MLRNTVNIRKDDNGMEYTTTGLEKIADNPFIMKVLEFMKDHFNMKGDWRKVVIAEDRGTGEFGWSVLHPTDEENNKYSKKLGRVIALGRLKKKLGVISK